MTSLIERYDGLLCDLDGVVYLGKEPIPAAVHGISELTASGVPVGYVTNNAMRSPADVAVHLNDLGIQAQASDVVTAGQAGAEILREQLRPGSAVLVMGTEALAEHVRERGFVPVEDASSHPAAVIQGYHPTLPWQLVNEACAAIQAGALWVQTNQDPTRPTEYGLQPGAGAQGYAVQVCVTVEPLVGGKPHRPLLNLAQSRCGMSRPLFVGDRLDTDIAGANNAGIDGLLVLTGAHGKWDLVTAPIEQRPRWIGHDLLAATQAPRRVTTTGDGPDTRWRCGTAEVQIDTGAVTATEPVPTNQHQQLDLVWAAIHCVWEAPGVHAHELLEQCTLVS